MQQKYLDNYEAFKSSINRVLDDIIDMIDATEQAGIKDGRTEALHSTMDKYEELRRHFLDKEELSPFEENELMLIMSQVISTMKISRTRLSKSINSLNEIIKKTWKISNLNT